MTDDFYYNGEILDDAQAERIADEFELGFDECQVKSVHLSSRGRLYNALRELSFSDEEIAQLNNYAQSIHTPVSLITKRSVQKELHIA